MTDVRGVERPLVTSRFNAHYRKSATATETIDATYIASCDSRSCSSVFQKSETWSNANNSTDNVPGRPEFSVGLRNARSVHGNGESRSKR
jgi:hypothetical protein